MKNKCDIVQDLLPAYLENTCSDASRKYVEEHLAECEECRQLVQACCHSTADAKEISVLPTAESVLKKVSWRLHTKAILNCLGLTVIVLYWPLYFWAKCFADLGDYRYFSWSFWEIFSSGSVYLPLLTAVWAVVLVVQSVRNKTWKKNAVVGLILLLLLGAQFGYLHSRSNIVYADSWTTVESIPDEYHIVISTGSDENPAAITLETTPMVTRLLKTDGTVYGFQYEHKKDDPDRGILTGIFDPED